jgi:hypothetical protein
VVVDDFVSRSGLGGLPSRRYSWRDESGLHELTLAFLPATDGAPYECGNGPDRRAIELPSFFIGTTAVTQALWRHVMGSNPAVRPGPRCPVENVPWDPSGRG